MAAARDQAARVFRPEPETAVTTSISRSFGIGSTTPSGSSSRAASSLSAAVAPGLMPPDAIFWSRRKPVPARPWPLAS